jgi:hypothetical protein
MSPKPFFPGCPGRRAFRPVRWTPSVQGISPPNQERSRHVVHDIGRSTFPARVVMPRTSTQTRESHHDGDGIVDTAIRINEDRFIRWYPHVGQDSLSVNPPDKGQGAV